MGDQVKYGARPSQVSKTAAGCPGCHGRRVIKPPERPSEKDKEKKQ